MKKYVLASFIALLLYVGKTVIDAVEHVTLVRNANIEKVLR